MKKPLLDVMFASEKRKNVLLLMQDGPKKMEYLLQSLNTSRQALLPQTKILEEHYLIQHEKDTYMLTHVGKLIIDEIAPAIGTVDVLSNDIDYWGTHNFDFIPLHLLSRIRELGLCNSVEVKMQDIFDEDATFVEEAKRTKFLFTVTSFVFPHMRKLVSELTEMNVKISSIISSGLYEKLVHENPEEIKYFLQFQNTEFYRYPDKLGFLSFTMTDHRIMFRLLTLKGDYDNNRIVCSGDSALKWGKELYEYYLKSSILITAIDE
jgi:predicted transcriptional regulator